MIRKLKYVIVSIIAMLITISAVWTISRAYTAQEIHGFLDDIVNNGNWYVGEGFPMSFEILQSRNDLFCVQHDAEMRAEYDYRLAKYFRIEGNRATDENGQKWVTSNLNGMMAYIASTGEGYGKWTSDGSGYTQTQKALYAFINSWFSTVGSQFGYNMANGGNSAFENNSNGQNSVYQAAKKYAESIGNTGTTEKPTDQTNKNNLKVTSVVKNGVSYIQVGPFNWKFSGTINKIELTGSGKTVKVENQTNSGLWVSKYNGNQEVDIYPNQLKSGENFYLRIRTDSGISQITQIKGTGKSAAETYLTADLFFFESDNKQNLVLVDSQKGNVSQDIEVTFKQTIPLTKKITVIKVDKDNNSIPLANVGFKFYYKELGQYLKITNGQVSYVSNQADATEFVTDSNGKITLNNVLEGTYIAYETKNPNYGYAFNDEGIVIASDASSCTITNEDITKDLVIYKVDSENNQIYLEGVGFIFYNSDTKQYIKDQKLNGSETTYTYTSNRDEAKEFFTDANGRINLPNIIEGRYIAYETQNPNYGYAFDSDGVVIENNETEHTIINDNITKDLLIHKLDSDDSEVRLEGVGFIFYNKDTGEYIKEQNLNGADSTYTYTTNKDEAKEFFTDANGEIYLPNVIEGTYVAYETQNPNYGYAFIGEGVEIAGNVTDFDIVNENITKDLVIYKTDSDDESVYLEGVGFIFYNKDTGEYIKEQIVDGDANDPNSYSYTYTTNRNEALVFYTDENGRINLPNIIEGTYIAYETENPNYGYAMIGDEGVEIPADATEFEIVNENITKDLVIYKTDSDDETIYLEGVGFIFYNKDTGEYIKEQIVDGDPEDPNSYSYTYTKDRNEALVFYTDANGMINLPNIIEGTYIAYETENPNYGYAMIGDEGVEIPFEDTEFEIVNENITRDLVIYKRDSDDDKIYLEGVGFIFYNKDMGQYIKEQIVDGDPNDPNSYSYTYTPNRDEALEFVTDENGKINLPNIIEGEYIAYETKNPNYGYAMIGEEGVQIPADPTEYDIINENITRDLVIYKGDSDDETVFLEGVGFIFYNKDMGQYIKEQIVDGDPNDPNSYSYTYTPNRDEALEFVTDENGKINLPNIIEGEYIAYETKNPNYGYAMIGEEGVQIPADPTEYEIINENITKDLVVYKVDADNNQLRLEGVGFIFYNQDTGEYIKEQILDGDPSNPNNYSYTYTPNREEALEFFTDENGVINLPNIIEGTYLAYETTMGDNYGYVIMEDGYEIPFEDTEIEIPNKQVYVKLSGYVWEDIQSEKQSIRNDLYLDSENDDKDIRVPGVPVVLKDKTTGQIVVDPITGEQQITETNENGEYLFENVEIDNLPNYYVEFTYDGLTYQNVIPHLDVDNGSKAAEPDRQGFNNKFASVEVGSRENQAAIKDASGNVQGTVDYEFTEETNGRTASIVSTNNLEITATTDAAGYTIPFTRGSGESEVKNINLGIYKRRQADLALQKELDQVKVEIQGYGHIYKYGSGYNTSDPNEVANSWNLGVRFENPYKNVYKRPIYRADAEYESDDDSKELKVAVTYKITLANQETLTAKVNRIVDYFDARYTVKGVGTGVNEQDGSITNPLQYTESNYNDKYKKVDIYANTLVGESGENTTAEKVTQQSIYIQFDLSRQNIINMLNEGSIYNNDENALENADKNLKNTAEIASFTTYSDANGTTLYAAVDKDSIPGNATVEQYNTYEDDTDKASTLAIVIANAREVSGTVFEDLRDENKLNTQNEVEGDSVYDPATENAIGGVTVQLVEVDASGNPTDTVAKVFDEQVVNDDGSLGAWTDATAESVTNSQGNYTISGFVPGRYAIRFTWGDGSYRIINGLQGDAYESMVENYKSTTIDYDRYQSEAGNSKFYRDVSQSGVRNSHAIDNIDTRKQIDDAFKTYSFKSSTDITQMTSTTPTLEFNVEYDDNDLMSIDLDRIENRIAFAINNMDFGIIRRPDQNVNLVKTVSEMQLVLANGQTLVNAQVDANGNLTGQTNYTTYLPPTKQNGLTVDNGYLKVEMDTNLIQGSTVRLKYTLTAENSSQADYVDDTYGYYRFGDSYYTKAVGEDRKDTDVVTISPSRIIDYLDSSCTYEPSDPTNIEYRWQEISVDDLQNGSIVASNVIDSIRNGTFDTGNVDGSGASITEDLDNMQIFSTDYLNNANLKPIYFKGNTLLSAESGSVQMVVTKILSEAEDTNFQNQAEIVEITKPGGGKFVPTPGNYVPSKVQKETDDATSQEVTVVPSTGGDKNYVLPISVGLVAFVVLGLGVILIKKKVIDPRKNK